MPSADMKSAVTRYDGKRNQPHPGLELDMNYNFEHHYQILQQQYQEHALTSRKVVGRSRSTRNPGLLERILKLNVTTKNRQAH